MPESAPIPLERIQSRIVVLRGQRVLWDADLVALPRFVTAIVEALHRLAEPVPSEQRRRIGFGAA
jgi:hypothetical protein